MGASWAGGRSVMRTPPRSVQGWTNARGRKTQARKTLKRKIAATAFATVMAMSSATREPDVTTPAIMSAPVVSAKLIA